MAALFFNRRSVGPQVKIDRQFSMIYH